MILLYILLSLLTTGISSLVTQSNSRSLLLYKSNILNYEFLKISCNQYFTFNKRNSISNSCNTICNSEYCNILCILYKQYNKLNEDDLINWPPKIEFCDHLYLIKTPKYISYKLPFDTLQIHNIFNISYYYCESHSKNGYSIYISSKCYESLLEYFPSSIKIILSLSYLSISSREFMHSEILTLEAIKLINSKSNNINGLNKFISKYMLFQNFKPKHWCLHNFIFSSIYLVEPYDYVISSKSFVQFYSDIKTELNYVLTLSYTEGGKHEKALPIAIDNFIDSSTNSLVPSFFYSAYKSSLELLQFDALNKLEKWGELAVSAYAEETGTYLHPFSILSWPFLSLKTAFKIVQNVGSREVCLFKKPYFDRKLRHKKIRIGYISPDFHSSHPVGVLLYSLFELHNSDEFEIHCFSLSKIANDTYQNRYKQTCSRFVDVSTMTDIELFESIFESEIDIMVDLIGYCLKHVSRVLCGSPAPIILNFLGYSYSLGNYFTSYIVTDMFTTPESSAPYYSEKFLYLPEKMTYFLNSHKFIPEYKSIEEFNEIHLIDNAESLTSLRLRFSLPSTGFLIGCFSALFKIASLLPIWVQALKLSTNIYLILRDSLNEKTKYNIINLLKSHAIDISRVIFATRVSKSEVHLQRLTSLDLYLDSTPYNSHSVGIDVLYSGLPMLTLPNQIFGSRVGLSLIQASGCNNLPYDKANLSKKFVQHFSYDNSLNYINISFAANSEIEYKLLLEELILNKELLSSYRKNTSSLFDTPNYVRHLESGYKLILNKFYKNENLTHIQIPQLDLIKINQSNSNTFTSHTPPKYKVDSLIFNAQVDIDSNININFTEATSVITPFDFSSLSDRTATPLLLLSNLECFDKCMNRNFSELILSLDGLTDKAFNWAKFPNGSLYNLDVSPFFSSDILKKSADYYYDMRELSHRNSDDWCKHVISNNFTSIFIRTEYFYKFLSDVYPFCFIKEPTIIVGDSDVGTPSLTLATHPMHYDIKFQNMKPSRSNVLGIFLKKTSKLFIQNYDYNYKLNSVTPILLGLTSGHWVAKQLTIFCDQLKSRFQTESINVGYFKRNKLLHVRIKMKNNYKERLEIGRVISKLKDSIPSDLITYSTSFQNITEYLTDLRSHKFVISPAGRGLDTHRTYESLLMGCIPIIRRSGIIYAYEDLPILIVDNWDQLTLEFIINGYKRLTDNSNSYKWEKLFSTYWENKLKNN